MILQAMKKLSTNFLILNYLIFSSNTLLAQSQEMKAYSPAQCIGASPTCLCFYPDAMHKISTGLKERETLQFELAQYKQFSSTVEATGWYNDPALFYATLAVSALLAGMVGYTLGAAK